MMNCSLNCSLHPGEPLDLVCICPGCQQKGLLCFLCKLEQHAEHQPILSLKMLLSELMNTTAGKQAFVRETSLIDRELLTLQSLVINLKKKMVNPELVDESFHSYWRHMVATVVQFEQIILELKEILKKKDEQLVVAFNAWIRKNGSKYIAQKDEEGNQGSLYSTFLKERLNSIITTREVAEKLQANGHYDDSEVLSLFIIHQPSTGAFRLRFSEELKGACMTISAPNKASMTSHGNQRMMLLQPHLGITRSTKKWKVKVEKLASWVGVGVAHLDSIKGVNFDFSYTNANHGNYLISSNGYSWNGYKMLYNSKYETPQFTTGDTIEVTYDPVNCKVSFKKEGNEQAFTYDVDPNQKPIHAAINMSGVGDAVQIL